MSRFTKISEAIEVIETYPMMRNGYVAGDSLAKSIGEIDTDFHAAVQFLRGYITNCEEYQARLVGLSLDALASANRASAGTKFAQLDTVPYVPKR